jgi:dihydrodipicolinate synthase/N-acetylneuraminate lyase
MLLPCADPRDAAGLERGYRVFAEASQTRLIVYLKEENNFGANKDAGLDVVARLVRDGICVGVKYAVIRENPEQDAYLEALLARVGREHVISGIGERPAVAHLRKFGLPGFTTGSGCVAPALSRALFEHCAAQSWDEALQVREHFLPLEDLRDLWGPARVLHSATQLADIAATGDIAPYVSMLDSSQLTRLAPVAQQLAARNAEFRGELVAGAARHNR